MMRTATLVGGLLCSSSASWSSLWSSDTIEGENTIKERETQQTLAKREKKTPPQEPEPKLTGFERFPTRMDQDGHVLENEEKDDDSTKDWTPLGDLSEVPVLLHHPSFIETHRTDHVKNYVRPEVGKNFTLKLQDFERAFARGYPNFPDVFCAVLETYVTEKQFKVQGKYPVLCQVFTGTGLQITKFEQIKPHDLLYYAPHPLPFVWPTIEIGHTVTLDWMDPVEGFDTPIQLETISNRPRVFRLKNFISEAEINDMVARASESNLTRSTGGLGQDGSSEQNSGQISDTRTSTNTWDITSPTSMILKNRSFQVIRSIPYDDEWSDGLQVVHYDPGQFYNSHTDWFDLGQSAEAGVNWNWDPSTKGINRIATVFFYLNSVEEGGATSFPRAEIKPEVDASKTAYIHELRDKLVEEGAIKKDSMEYGLIDECREVLHVPPVRGEAILFYHVDSRGILDIQAEHAACPVLKGEKLGANLWLWNGHVYSSWFARQLNGLPPETTKGYFVNNLDQTMELYWIAQHNNEQVFLGEILPGDTYVSNTYPGHRFVRKLSEDGEILQEWTMHNDDKRNVAPFDKGSDFDKSQIPWFNSEHDEL